MVWIVIISERFSEEFKKFEKDKQFVDALESKIKRLQENPDIGGHLAGRLHGYKSIRLVRKYRIIFRVDEGEKKIYLVAIDHRGYDYKRF